MRRVDEAIEQEGRGFPNPWSVSEEVINSEQYRKKAIQLAGIQKEIKILENENATELKKEMAKKSILNKLMQKTNKLFGEFESAENKITSYVNEIVSNMDDIAQSIEENLESEDQSIEVIDNGMNILIGMLSVLQLFLKQTNENVQKSAEQIKKI